MHSWRQNLGEGHAGAQEPSAPTASGRAWLQKGLKADPALQSSQYSGRKAMLAGTDSVGGRGCRGSMIHGPADDSLCQRAGS